MSTDVTAPPRSVVLLGSTGSIGTQAIDVLSRHPDRFEVTGISAGGADPRTLGQQAVALGAQAVAVADPDAAGPVLAAVADAAFASGRPFAGIEVLTGPDAAARLAARGADVVLNGITGSVGLGPTLAALEAGSTLALANKESLVVGGPLVAAALQRPDQIVPVDSEHSAIAQALRSGRHDAAGASAAGTPVAGPSGAGSEVRRLILTASGGPFRGRDRDALKRVTRDEALAHPTWSMGPVVTVNSATLMNKGLELIEAHLLFGIPTQDITVVVHPQSVVHSMVEFVDGSTIAQASPPDMRLPIALGLSWPDRLPAVTPPCDWSASTSWTFEPLDEVAFPAVALAREAVGASATHPAVLNAANEQCVAGFLAGRVGFLDIVDTVAAVLAEHTGAPAAGLVLEEVLEAERWARARAEELLARR